MPPASHPRPPRPSRARIVTRARIVPGAATALAVLLAAAPRIGAQTVFDSLHFRSIGPAVTGGRIHDIQVDPTDPATIYVATATGGIWKTTSHATVWTPVFDGQPENTFGSLAIFTGDPRIVWAGSGEQNNRQSSSWGSGVYRTTDGGATWTHVGLAGTRSIGRVRLHPTDPNVAYVAAVGDLWRPSAERGVFRTTDGGRTWAKVLYVDTLTGATDLAMDPRDPRVLYAAMYQRLRSVFGFNGGGPGSAIYKSTDAGSTWTKLERGLPAGDKGRIALAIAASRPDVLIALVEHPSEGGTYRSDDAGATWRRTSRTNPRPMYFSAPYIDPTTDQRVWVLGVAIHKSEDGGATFETMPNSPTYDVGLKTDHHAMWIDPQHPRHLLVAGDGGVHESWDLGLTYTRLNNLPIGQFYRITADDRDPYWVYGGLQDTHSWMGPSATRHWLGILNQDWRQIGFSDGTGQQVDLRGYRVVYTSSDEGNVQRFDPETGDRLDIKPVPPAGEPPYRFDWDAPLLASRHTPGTVYLGGNRLFISRDYGATWTRTPDLTRRIDRDTLVLMGVRDRDVRIARNDGETSFSELTAIAESPLDAAVLWVGTDDGAVHLSRDGGATWREVGASIPGVPAGTYVARVVASAAGRGTAIVAFDAHRAGDVAPYVVRTTDFGRTWTAAGQGLPADAPVRSLAEYPGRAHVLFAGTERALFVSTDSGAHWMRLSANLPTTRYDDVLVHPRTKDLILGTHGRSVWILDDASPIAEWSSALAARPSYLFPVRRATLMQYWEDISNTAQGLYAGENPAEGATFTYHLAHPARAVRLVVRGRTGAVIRELAGSGSAGTIHRTSWDLRHEPPPASAVTAGGGEEGGGGGTSARALPVPPHDIGPRGPYVAPGVYRVTLDVDGDTTSRAFEVRDDPASRVTLAGHRTREAFLVAVADAQRAVEARAAELRARRAAGDAVEADRLAALERRLVGGRESARAKLGAVSRAFNGAGAQQGSFFPPTAAHRQLLADARAALAAADTALGRQAAPR